MARFDDYSRSQIVNAIDEWVHNEKHRFILKRRLLDGICYEPLAEEVEMSPRQIKQIVYKYQIIVFKHLRDGTG